MLPPPDVCDRFRQFLSLGGLAQLLSLPGGSRTQFAISCVLDSPPQMQSAPLFSHSISHAHAPHVNALPYSVFISDEGFLSPEGLSQFRLPLQNFILVKPPSPREVWRVALESIQTGLFSWILLRPSAPCIPNALRKLQLSAEKTKSRVFIFPKQKLPHWTLRVSLELPAHAHSLLPTFRSHSRTD